MISYYISLSQLDRAIRHEVERTHDHRGVRLRSWRSLAGGVIELKFRTRWDKDSGATVRFTPAPGAVVNCELN